MREIDNALVSFDIGIQCRLRRCAVVTANGSSTCNTWSSCKLGQRPLLAAAKGGAWSDFHLLASELLVLDVKQTNQTGQWHSMASVQPIASMAAESLGN
jgi:hypothetical protein